MLSPQLDFQYVLDPNGRGDYSSLQTLTEAQDGKSYSALLKSGTYPETGGVTIDENDCYIFVAPGSTITGAITISGNGVTLVLGPGCTLSGLITLSGNNIQLLMMGGCSLVGIDSTGDDNLVHGGGWGSLSNGDDADGYQVSGTRNRLECIGVKTTAGGGNGVDGVDATPAGCTYFQAISVYVVDSDQNGMSLQRDDQEAEGCYVAGADSQGINSNGARSRRTGNYIIATGNSGIQFDSSGDDSIATGNIVKDPGTDPIKIEAACENNVASGNRTDGAISDSSGTSTPATMSDNNDETAF